MNKLRRRRPGYTLLEMLIVLAIIGLIVALVGPRLSAQLDRSKVTAAKVQLRSLSAALETMRLDLGRYPSETEGLEILLQPPGDLGAPGASWQGPYLETDSGAPPLDPWGRPYVYEAPLNPDARPKIVTLGADGKVGGTGNSADLQSRSGG